jgi:hypothetical protein
VVASATVPAALRGEEAAQGDAEPSEG